MKKEKMQGKDLWTARRKTSTGNDPRDWTYKEIPQAFMIR
jgi:hypothetical protein